jgi:putative membrane protein
LPVCDDGAVVAAQARRTGQASFGGVGVKGFLITLVVTSIAIVIVSYILPEFRFKNASDHIPQVVILALIIGVVNSLIKPVVGLLSFPVNAMTLGLFGVVVNGLLLLLVAWVANTWFNVPFTIAGFPDSALSLSAVVWAIIASIAMGIITAVIGRVVPD